MDTLSVPKRHITKIVEPVLYCPKCGNEMDAVSHNPNDKLIIKAMLGLLYVKRYLCYGCLWESRIAGKSQY